MGVLHADQERAQFDSVEMFGAGNSGTNPGMVIGFGGKVKFGCISFRNIFLMEEMSSFIAENMPGSHGAHEGREQDM